jgi:hypothetical protein
MAHQCHFPKISYKLSCLVSGLYLPLEFIFRARIKKYYSGFCCYWIVEREFAFFLLRFSAVCGAPPLEEKWTKLLLLLLSVYAVSLLH